MASKIQILDGGLGTSLIYDYGVIFTDGTPLWTSHVLLSDRDTLLRCQRDFGNVPVDIILTSTYQASADGFAQTKTRDYPQGIPASRVPGILNDSVRVAEEAKQPGAKVALSVGAYGATMKPCQEYTGRYDAAHGSAQRLQVWHRERLALFVAGVPDLESRIGYMAMETIPRADEIEALRRAVDDVPALAGIPFWVACTFPGDELTLPSGDSIATAVEAMLSPRVAKATPWAVGINCTDLWKMDPLLRQFEAAVEDALRKGYIQEWPALVMYPDGKNGKLYNVERGDWDLPQINRNPGEVPWERLTADVVRATEARGQWKQIVADVAYSGSDIIGGDDEQTQNSLILDVVE
ncbi:hypothetical protein C2857_003889 [Epichloe festucae Fl1]|uniref:Hcy-binding domain-containing protein n=1 Tax=Epichloe festucae (strain Fl1) TaxID=877507 RepID=A0A7S9PTY9_EPIFF|nr:hypothetical protein C2857_003889 [Epichloe festucae Fl1]